MTPHLGFINSLRAFDPLLSVRWGSVIGQWVIERKAFVPVDEINFLTKRLARVDKKIKNSGKEITHKDVTTFTGVSEELASAKVGARVMLFAKNLDARVFDDLALGDIRRYGGYSRYADELEAQEERKEKDEERMAANEREALNKQVYDDLNYIWDKNETALLNGERNWQKLLR